jgi:hypothetical protein
LLCCAFGWQLLEGLSATLGLLAHMALSAPAPLPLCLSLPWSRCLCACARCGVGALGVAWRRVRACAVEATVGLAAVAEDAVLCSRPMKADSCVGRRVAACGSCVCFAASAQPWPSELWPARCVARPARELELRPWPCLISYLVDPPRPRRLNALGTRTAGCGLLPTVPGLLCLL